MLVLKGCGGKSYILDALMCTYKDNCIGIVYKKDAYNIPFGTYLVNADECNMSEFCKELPNLVMDNSKDRFCRMVVVYTNFKEDEISEIKEAIKDMEYYCCSTGIVMCKE